MPNVPSQVLYGKITGHLVSFIADTDDTGNEPDEVALNGIITLTPTVNVIRFTSTTPPRIAVVNPVNVSVVNGAVISPTGGEVWVIASDQPDGEPDHLQWTAEFKLNNVLVQPAKVTFDVPSGSGGIDLATVVGVTAVPPVVHLVSAGDVGTAVEDYLIANPISVDPLPARTGADDGKLLILSGTTPGWIAPSSVPAISTLSTNLTNLTNTLNTRVPAGSSGVNNYILKYNHTLGGGEWVVAPTGGGITSVASTDITDSTTTGRAVLTAASQAAARTALGGVPLIGTTSSTAKAGNWVPASTDISDSTATGRTLLTAGSVSAVNTYLGSGPPTLENIPDVFRHYNTGTSSYPARGTTRTDITIVWVGPVPPTGNIANDIWDQTA